MTEQQTKVTSNYHWYTPVSWYDLPTNQQKWFDYVEGEDRYTPRFVKYCNAWYDLSDGFIRIHARGSNDPHALRVPEDSPLHKWHGAQSDSHWSGVLVKYSDDWEQVQMGRYTN